MLEALEFAALAHKDQVRKDSEKTPYFSHPVAVALILSKAGFPEEVVIAGLLHDVIEDTSYTEKDIRERFGDRVVELVLGVTEDSALPWVERKVKYNKNLEKADAETKALSAADLLANRRSRLIILRQGINAWKFFDKDPDAYARRVLANDLQRIKIIKSGLQHPMIKELEAVEQEVIEFMDNTSNKI